jgi:hypothetical protein
MATVTVDHNFVWSVETNKALGFATKDDLMLGDMLISKRLDLDGVIDEAWIEIESVLGARYVTPIDRSQMLPHHTTQFLTRIHAYLATSIAVLGQAGAANPDALAYSQYLRERAMELVDKVVEGGTVLGGLTNTTNDTQGRSFAPSVFVKEESPFAYFEQSFHTDNRARQSWRPGSDWDDPNT